MTPGMASASLVSMLLISAEAIPARLILAKSMLGKYMSSMYFVCPSPCRRPSARDARWPTAGVCWRPSGTTTSTGNVTSGAGAGARRISGLSNILGLSATFERSSAMSGLLISCLAAVLAFSLHRRYFFAAQDACGAFNRFDHLGVSGAPAQIAAQRVANLLRGRIGILVQQRLGRHDHSRPAES